MDARKGNIYEILNGNKQFLIPVYQRFYSWDIEQCQKLWKMASGLFPVCSVFSFAAERGF